ncbi:SGNH/GDSL hydrolase family protein [Actinocorallia sp. API 0066]|uniref:SGNH/GDSL hydrolase family protein n=1 Tax=Actinocorallia sp. API 0066 TaxID=2896846 RepID=UPI001E4C9F56|nr:SGNH/GDSL hydrolase family protein [Actinocorallia sp. API 0066]MCD0453476.1 SGNH/GDSL hydrolase family protein [Actinocorallia sp. API 0066]
MTAENAEPTDPYCLPDADADRLLAAAPWKRFAVVGDSLAEGLGEATPGYRTLPWADRTREALARVQPDLEYLNIGLRDLIASEVREQQLERALEFGPDLAAVVCGGNDLLRPVVDLDAVEGELDTIIGSLAATGTTVVTYCLMDICAAFPELAALSPKMQELNARVRGVSARHGALVVDMWAHPACAEKSMYSSDLLHSSMRGHALLAAETLKRLGSHLADA